MSMFANLLSDWPSEGLESVARCPICDATGRKKAHEDLRDYAFGAAPGSWTLWICADCSCGFLDPRPNKATIALAYSEYYTHHQSAAPPTETRFARFRRRIAEAYLNEKYGAAYPDTLPGGFRIAQLFPRSRAFLDTYYARQLPRATHRGGRLLDVGCGASRRGWVAEGIDPDPVAVAAAQSAGANVTQASLDDLPQPSGTFEHVTLSHVLEHVHDPVRLLRQCLELLVPGGRLWLQTPNLESLGHSVFGSAWRGLEPPRHLVLFNQSTLHDQLRAAGFASIRFFLHPGVSEYMWSQSRMIARKSTSAPDSFLRGLLSTSAGRRMAEIYSLVRATRSEFLTCVAFRPIVM
jgi:SAM-dependent methyltransferase